MNTPASLLAIAALPLLATLAVACECGGNKSATAPAATPAATAEAAAEAAPKPAAEPGHPLRGVIVDVLPERQALLVHHEEIPGVMREMTMLLKVDAPTLAAAKKGGAITATLIRKTDGWWLENVAPVATP